MDSRNLSASLGLVLAALAFAVVGGQAQQKAEPAAVSGVIVDGATGRPIPGGFVEINRTDAGRTVTKRVGADSRGRFVIAEIEPAAGYWLSGSASGYVSSEYGWEPGATESLRDRLTFRLGNGEWKRDVTMRLWRRAVISGRVVDELGHPVAGIALRAYTAAFVGGIERLIGTGLVASTDDRGVYRLAGLEPGRYKVGVMCVQSTVPASVPEALQDRAIGAFVFGLRSGDGSLVSSPAVNAGESHRLAITTFGVPPAPEGGQARAYPPLFYPGGRSLADAEWLALEWGSERANIDFRIQPAPAFAVSGRLDPAPQGPLLLRLMPAGFEHLPVGAEVATTVTEKDGAFTFLNVPAGSYTLIGQDSILELMATPASNDVVPDPAGFPAVSNGGGGAGPSIDYVLRRGVPNASFVRQHVAISNDVTNLVVRGEVTATVRGRVVYADGSTPPALNSYLPISLEAIDGDPTLGNPSAYVDAKAAFDIHGVQPGRYRIWASGRVFSSIVWEGRDIAESGLDIAPGQAVADVVITFTGRPAGVDATVTGLTGDARAAVIIFPAAREQWTNHGRNTLRIASGLTNTERIATFARMPAGDYFVVAVPPGRANARVDPAFLEAASRVATRVSVGWGETRAVTLTVRTVVVR